MSAADTFLPHELTEGQIAELRKVFDSEPDIGSAAVARKKVNYLPNNPCFGIAIKIKGRGNNTSQLVHRVVKQVRLQGNFLVFVDENNLRGLAAEVFHVPGSVVYERPTK